MLFKKWFSFFSNRKRSKEDEEVAREERSLEDLRKGKNPPSRNDKYDRNEEKRETFKQIEKELNKMGESDD